MSLAKKPRTEPPHASRLAALPPALVESVLDFLVDEHALRDHGAQYFVRDFGGLTEMKGVSKEWRALATEAASARHLKAFCVEDRIHGWWEGPVKRSEMLRDRHQVILRRVHLQRLVVHDTQWFGTIGAGVWNAVLSHVPRLKALEMDPPIEETRSSARAVDITRAAARYCKELKVLIMPTMFAPPRDEERAVQRGPKGHHMRAVSAALYDGLSVWAQRGGLQHLRFSMFEIMKSFKDTKTFFDHITEYCPRIERLDSYGPIRMGMGQLKGETFWKVDLELWDRFCRVCDRLEVFDWRCAPFATALLEAFGAHHKPKLSFLSLSTSENWKWAPYFKAVGPTTEALIKKSGYGATAVRPEMALQAAPNLEILRIECEDDIFLRPNKDRVNPEIFGDEFIEAVARHCKKLKQLTHCAVPPMTRMCVTSFTDRSLQALATLPELEWIDLVGANITGDGLFDLVANHVASTRHVREYFIHIGGRRNSSHAMMFYDVLGKFLERLVAHSGELPCQSRPVVFHLINLNESNVEEGWSAAYFGHVLQLTEQAHAQHPSLQMHGLVNGYDSEFGVMKRVREFKFATASAKLPAWEEDSMEVDGWDDRIDDVFTNRWYGDERN